MTGVFWVNSSACEIKYNGKVQYITFPEFNKIDFINHAISTRHGGVSDSEHTKSMNLGLKSEDTLKVVKENYRLFCEATGITFNNMVHANQTHSSNILKVTAKDKGKGLFSMRDYNDIDGLITNEPNIPLVILTADCVPVLYCDTKHKVIGAAHCGWRGTYSLLQTKMIDEMKNSYGSNVKDIKIAIAPSVKSCCYEVSKELYEDFKANIGYYSNGFCERQGRYYLDLQEINKALLMNCGILEENIFLSDICTCCNSNDLFSHRVMGFKRGMIASVIEIK